MRKLKWFVDAKCTTSDFATCVWGRVARSKTSENLENKPANMVLHVYGDELHEGKHLKI